MDQDGAHTLGMNDKAIGICCVGNFDVQTPTETMLARLVPLLRWLMDVYGIPAKNVMGHRDYSPKSCPGKNFDMDALRARL
jgi:N-acetyl-anhydromuramyl-L-alanine amidase AmpD